MPTTEITQDAAGSRFVMRLEGEVAELTYRLSGTRLILDYVGVPPAWRHRGLAGALTRTALEYAREHSLEVVPVCPYVVWYLTQHPEYRELVKT